jgi:hypothetical protein
MTYHIIQTPPTVATAKEICAADGSGRGYVKNSPAAGVQNG